VILKSLTDGLQPCVLIAVLI